MKKKVLAIFGMLAVQAVLPAGAASPAGPLPVDEAFAMTVSPGPGGSLAVEWAIADGYYLYRDRVAARAQDGADQIIETVPGVAKDDPNFGRSEIYYGRAKAVVRRPGAHPVELTYQGCQKNGICYAPETRKIDPVSLAVSGSTPAEGASVEWSTDDAPQSPNATGPQEAPGSTGLMIAADQRLVQSFLYKGGSALVLAMFALFGMLLAFTPCVFPMYLIPAGALAREGDRLTPGKGFSCRRPMSLASPQVQSAIGKVGVTDQARAARPGAAYHARKFESCRTSPVATLISRMPILRRSPSSRSRCPSDHFPKGRWGFFLRRASRNCRRRAVADARFLPMTCF